MNIPSNHQRDQLAAMAEEADRSANWPDASMLILREIGAPAWSIPVEFGGAGCEPVDVLRGLEEIATSCLTSAFIFSQREAAVRHLLRSPEVVKEKYLHRLAAGEIYATVGLSQLTTSRQHLGPALTATSTANGCWQLNGQVPWVTGADHAAVVIVGATVTDGRQLLVAIPAERLAVAIESPLPLAALTGSRTSLIQCDHLEINPDWILAGPVESVLGKSGGGGLDTSCLAIGLAGAAIRSIRDESKARPDLVPIVDTFETALERHRQQLHALAGTVFDSSVALDLRTECTKLALRATQASLMIAKGVGFVAPHPAQRWARQAMFFLVWSCPRPVAEGVLADLVRS